MSSPSAPQALALCALVACTPADREASSGTGAPAPSGSIAPAPADREASSGTGAPAPSGSIAPAPADREASSGTGAPAPSGSTAPAPPPAPGAPPAAEPAPPPPEPPAPPPPEPAPAASDPPDDVFVRLARWRPDLESACSLRPRLACTRTGDLDGDGQPDEVALVRRRGSKQIGLAIAWGRGGGEVLGAGERGRVWRETNDESTRTTAIPTDFSWLARWDVWLADGPPGKRRGLRDARGRRFALAGVVGDGLLLDGGDSATVAYWDGQRWRHEYLGF